MRFAPVVLLSPAHLYKRHIELMFTQGEKDLLLDDSHSKRWFKYRFTVRFCITFFFK